MSCHSCHKDEAHLIDKHEASPWDTQIENIKHPFFQCLVSGDIEVKRVCYSMANASCTSGVVPSSPIDTT